MVIHPIEPLYNENSKILILGSFPSVKSREQLFFYGHPQNRFWRVLAAVFETEIPQTICEKREFILSHNIALWDSIASCDIVGSSDSSIKNVVPNDLRKILKEASINAIFTNGKTSDKYYNKYIKTQIGIESICLPSTSPANAMWTVDSLTGKWNIIKEYL